MARRATSGRGELPVSSISEPRLAQLVTSTAWTTAVEDPCVPLAWICRRGVNVNVDSGACPSPEATWWQEPDVRASLAGRDVAAIFAFLRRRGVSQRAIAALTGLAASEVYEITRGRRVMAYDVLCRIADGLSIPRGSMGLAYDNATAAFVATADRPTPTAEAEAAHLLTHAAAMTLGLAHSAEPTESDRWDGARRQPTPLPSRIGWSDVVQVEAITAGLRALDHQHGGGACREAVLAQAAWVSTLIAQEMPDDVRTRLHVALADLYNLAGWTSFDVGLSADARTHFAVALTHAQLGGEPSLTANILYRIGRIHLHDSMITEALRYFQLGQIAAHDSAQASCVSLLCANEAWAYGVLGNAEQAARSLARAHDELSRADSAESRPWMSFFGFTELTGLAGMMHLELAIGTASRGALTAAHERLTASIAAREGTRSRSCALDLAGLATAQLRAGNTAEGLALGNRAVDLAEQLWSIRVWQRFAPLARTANEVQSADAKALSQRVLLNLAP